MEMAPMCPACGRDAPIVYRGVVPYCTACGALRAPLSSPSVNLAGKPSKVGGAVASVFGWLVLLVGGSIAIGLGAFFLLFNLYAVAAALSLPILLVATVVGVMLLRSGRSLSRSGIEVERSMHEQALMALAAHRGGVTAHDAARALNIPVADADAMLTDLAKRDPDRVAVDVDDQGAVWYRVAGGPGEPLPHVRIGEEARVDAGAGEAEPTAAADEAKKQAGL
jgi:hypothetical protein